MVAELRTQQSPTVVLCFSSQTGQWVEKHLCRPLPPRTLAPHGVVSHAGKLWWVDLSWALLSCNPFEDAPLAVRVVHLPPSKQLLESRQEWIYLEKRRWVGVSAGTLRFVEMSGFPNRYDRDYDSDDAVDVSEIQINVWTLEDPDTSSWKLLYKMPVKKILGDDMYKAYELPSEVPELALMDPMDPRLLYFIVSNRIFSVNMVTKRVVTCERMDLAMQIPSRSVRPWLLPSILSADSDDVTGGLVELLAPQRFKRKHLHHRQLTSSANALNKNESQVNPEGVQPLF
ncbi:hypothetical protein VPH35_036377 [Triticum aestivum]